MSEDEALRADAIGAWEDLTSDLLSAVRAMAADYRARMRQPAAVLTLFLPGWSNPAHLSDDEFRATEGAAEARRSGFGVVQWGSPPIREIEL